MLRSPLTVCCARIGLVLVWAGLTGCASWRAVERRETWTLYAKSNEAVDVARFGRSLDLALVAVEETLGAFQRPVDVHVWNEDSSSARMREERGEFESVPGIGPARVRAFHVRSSINPFEASGIFLDSTDVGTAVHEFVHARLEDAGAQVPLWFEEGLACYLGDGAEYDDRWVVDGLCCWPLRELREERLSDGELRRLMSIGASDDCSARDNLLVHFIGWAIVFDLAQDQSQVDWREWLAEFQRGDPVARAREHMSRTLASQTHVAWLARLNHEDPGVRFATAKGTWKLRSSASLDLLLDRLEIEEEPEVEMALAINALLTAGETRIGGRGWGRLWRQVFPTLREATLADPAEQQSLDDLRRAMRGRWNPDATERALQGLSRFWAE